MLPPKFHYTRRVKRFGRISQGNRTWAGGWAKNKDSTDKKNKERIKARRICWRRRLGLELKDKCVFGSRSLLKQANWFNERNDPGLNRLRKNSLCGRQAKNPGLKPIHSIGFIGGVENPTLPPERRKASTGVRVQVSGDRRATETRTRVRVSERSGQTPKGWGCASKELGICADWIHAGWLRR